MRTTEATSEQTMRVHLLNIETTLEFNLKLITEKSRQHEASSNLSFFPFSLSYLCAVSPPLLSLSLLVHRWTVNSRENTFVHKLINLNLSCSHFMQMRASATDWASRLLSYHTVKRQVVSLMSILPGELLSMCSIWKREGGGGRRKVRVRDTLITCKSSKFIVCVVLFFVCSLLI